MGFAGIVICYMEVLNKKVLPLVNLFLNPYELGYIIILRKGALLNPNSHLHASNVGGLYLHE